MYWFPLCFHYTTTARPHKLSRVEKCFCTRFTTSTTSQTVLYCLIESLEASLLISERYSEFRLVRPSILVNFLFVPGTSLFKGIFSDPSPGTLFNSPMYRSKRNLYLCPSRNFNEKGHRHTQTHTHTHTHRHKDIELQRYG